MVQRTSFLNLKDDSLQKVCSPQGSNSNSTMPETVRYHFVLNVAADLLIYNVTQTYCEWTSSYPNDKMKTDKLELENSFQDLRLNIEDSQWYTYRWHNLLFYFLAENHILKLLLDIKATTNIILQELNSSDNVLHVTIPDGDDKLPAFPLSSIDDIIALENLLQEDETAVKQFVSIIDKIYGIKFSKIVFYRKLNFY